MPPAGFETAIPASDRRQTLALDRSGIGLASVDDTCVNTHNTPEFRPVFSALCVWSERKHTGGTNTITTHTGCQQEELPHPYFMMYFQFLQRKIGTVQYDDVFTYRTVPLH